MRIPHLIAAAAASIAFTVTPALAKQVLMRGAPEFPNGRTVETTRNDPGHVQRDKTTLSQGSAVTEYHWRRGSDQVDLWGTVTFEEPPAQIDLSTEESRTVTLKARGDLSGEVTCCYIGLAVSYDVEGGHGRDFSDKQISMRTVAPWARSVGRRPNYQGVEKEFWEVDGEQEIAAVLHVAPGQTSGFEIWVTVQAAGGRLHVRYPYELVEEPDEPEVADGIFPDVDFGNCGAANRAADDILDRYGNAMLELGEVSELLADILDTRRFEVSIESRYGKELEARLIWKGTTWRTFRDTYSAIGKLADLAGFSIPLSILRGRSIILLDLMVQDPSETISLDDAIEIIKEIHAATQVMGDNAQKLHNYIYCRKVLPEELAFEAIYHDGFGQVCLGDDIAAS